MKIAVVADRNRSYGRALCEGVASYALERTDWTLGLLDSDRPVGLKGYDAVVARIVSSEMLASLRRTNLPIVDVYCALPRGEAAGVDCDHRAVGRMAAEYFLDHRFTSFAYCGYDGVPFSDARYEAFAERLASDGYECLRYDSPKSVVDFFTGRLLRREDLSDTPDMRRLKSFAAKLPKSTAVFCSHDLRAYHFAAAVAAVGRSVPDDIAILGCDNDTLVCAFSPVPLSSIDPNAFEVGYGAAAMLDSMLSGGLHTQFETVAPRGVVERKSTEVYPLDPPWLSDALVYIHRHYSDNLSASDVYAHLGLSHTPIDKAFKDSLGISVHQEILRVKVEEAARLLRDGEATSVGEVARRCGFARQEHFWHAFKRRFGMSPSLYAAKSAKGKVGDGGAVCENRII